jgi:LPS-assembly lipoprotein
MSRCRIAASLLFLGACGFQPVYGGGTKGEVAASLAAVEVSLVPNRIGQQLRNELIDRLYQAGRPDSPAYRLDIQVMTSENRSGFRKDATATRGEVTVNASYALTDAGGSVVLRGRNSASAGFSIVTDQYGTLINEEDAYDRAVEQLAGDIVRRLALHFQY